MCTVGQSPPTFVRIKQKFDDSHIKDIAAECRATLISCGVKIQPGHEVAMTCGSCGIANIADIIKSVGDWVKEQGGRPFVVPSMGSHGGCTAEGQQQVSTPFDSNITERKVSRR